MLFGAHVSSAGGISKAIDRAEELGCDAVQIFTQSPRMWRPTAHTEDEVERFRERRDEVGIRVGRLPRPLSRQPRRARPRDPQEVGRGDARLARHGRRDRRRGRRLPPRLAPRRGIAKGLKRAVPPLRELLELTDDRLWLVLENSAGAGGTMGRSVAELAAIFDALDGHPRLGVCLDSCHWWVSGVDVTDPAALDDALARARRVDRARPAPLPARQRRRCSPRVEPRPPRDARGGADRRRDGDLPRPPRLPGPPGDPRDGGPDGLRRGAPAHARAVREGSPPPAERRLSGSSQRSCNCGAERRLQGCAPPQAGIPAAGSAPADSALRD